jgi:hypothetical protein
MCILTAFYLLLIDFTLLEHMVLGVTAGHRRGEAVTDQREKHG